MCKYMALIEVRGMGGNKVQRCQIPCPVDRVLGGHPGCGELHGRSRIICHAPNLLYRGPTSSLMVTTHCLP